MLHNSSTVDEAANVSSTYQCLAWTDYRNSQRPQLQRTDTTPKEKGFTESAEKDLVSLDFSRNCETTFDL